MRMAGSEVQTGLIIFFNLFVLMLNKHVDDLGAVHGAERDTS